MRTRTLLGTTLAFAALSASIAGVTAGAAEARPREINCIAIAQAMSDSVDMAQAYYADGDEAGGDEWLDQYYKASRNHDRYCL